MNKHNAKLKMEYLYAKYTLFKPKLFKVYDILSLVKYFKRMNYI